MSNPETRQQIITRALPVYDKHCYEVSWQNKHGGTFKMDMDGYRGLGRSVELVTIYPNHRAVEDSIEATWQRGVLPDRSQQQLQAWAERAAARLKKKATDPNVMTYSNFASREKALRDGSERVIRLGGLVTSEMVVLQLMTADALRLSRAGDFRVKVNTDLLPKKRGFQDGYQVFGLGEGTGSDTGGAWMPYYNLLREADAIFNDMRHDGAPIQKAYEAIPFRKLAKGYVSDKS